jgi:two-component system chemotaxis response regulator CheY
MAKILVVDDDPQARMLLQATLQELGHEPLLAVDGEAALALYEMAHPDVVITDLVMPVLNGVLLIEHLTNLEPLARIVAISGKGEDQLRRAKEAGAVAVLRKPIDRIQIMNEVDRVLAMKDRF